MGFLWDPAGSCGTLPGLASGAILLFFKRMLILESPHDCSGKDYDPAGFLKDRRAFGAEGIFGARLTLWGILSLSAEEMKNHTSIIDT